MISFMTLDEEVVRFDGNFTIMTCDWSDEEDEKLRRLMALFTNREKNNGIELNVYAFVFTGGKPIWGVASYGEQWSSLISSDSELTDEKTSEEAEIDALNEFSYANDLEKQLLEMYVKQFVIPSFVVYCQHLDDASLNIVDLRNAFYKDCFQWGYYPPDIADTSSYNEFSDMDIYLSALQNIKSSCIQR